MGRGCRVREWHGLNEYLELGFLIAAEQGLRVNVGQGRMLQDELQIELFNCTGK